VAREAEDLPSGDNLACLRCKTSCHRDTSSWGQTSVVKGACLPLTVQPGFITRQGGSIIQPGSISWTAQLH
jgi:hypothetical protein